MPAETADFVGDFVPADFSLDLVLAEAVVFSLVLVMVETAVLSLVLVLVETAVFSLGLVLAEAADFTPFFEATLLVLSSWWGLLG